MMGIQTVIGNGLVVFQLFNGWLDACMNYLYRISSDTGAIWIVEECHITQRKYVRFRAYMVLEM
jgi:hypothetical protein